MGLGFLIKEVVIVNDPLIFCTCLFFLPLHIIVLLFNILVWFFSYCFLYTPAFVVSKLLAVVESEWVRDISVNFHYHIANLKFSWRFRGVESKDVSIGVIKLVIFFLIFFSSDIRFFRLRFNRQRVQDSSTFWICWETNMDMS